MESVAAHYNIHDSTASSAFFILQWGRLSDRIGRRPVLLVGLTGLAVSMLCFGFAKSFPAIVISRVIAGALNGNVGVSKTVVSSLSFSVVVAHLG